MKTEIEAGVRAALLNHFQNNVDVQATEAQSNGHQTSKHTISRAKPAIRRTRLLPWQELSLHVVCIMTAAVIFALCGTNRYFSDFDRPNLNTILNALQFAAKSHEIVLGASLSAVVLYALHYQLCAAEGLPLGYVSYAFQLSKLDQLLSRDFWAPVQSKAQNRPGVRWFGVAISLATVTLAILGPSSAILLIPDLDWWPVPDPFSGHGGIMYLNASYDALWPSHINSSMIENVTECLSDGPMGVALPPRCPFNMMPEISQWLVNNYNRGSPPNITKSADLGVIRYLTSSLEATEFHTSDDIQGYSVGSSAMTFLSRNLDTIWLYGEKNKLSLTKPSRSRVSLSSMNQSRPLRRPLVQVQCGFPYDITSVDTINVTYPTDNIRNKSGVVEPLALSSTVNTTVFKNLTSGPLLQWIDFSGTTRRPTWGTVVGMKFFSPRLIFGPSFNGSEAVGLIPCTIESYWIPTQMARDPLFGSSLVVNNADPMDAVRNPSLMATARDLYIDSSFLDVANAPVADRAQPLGVIAWILDCLSYKPGHGFDGLWKDRWPWLVASVLSLSLTDGLARYADMEALYYWDVPPDLPINNSFVVDLRYIYSGDVYNYELPAQYNYHLAELIRGNGDVYTEVKWTVERYGYAWGLRSATKRLAVTVIALHTLLVLAYLSVILVQQWRCDSWTSLTDLLVLAIQSPRSRSLERPTAGVSNRFASGHNVQILEDIIDGKHAVLEVGSKDFLLEENDHASDKEDVQGGGYNSMRKLKAEKKYL